MAAKHPLALYDGRIEELRPADTLRDVPALEPHQSLYRWRTDFDVVSTADGYFTAVQGSGTSVVSPYADYSGSRRVYGVAQLTTGTTSTGSAAVMSHSGNPLAWKLIQLGDGRTHEFVAAVTASALPNGTDNYWASAGWLSNNDASANGNAVHLVYGSGFSLPLSDRWYLRTVASGTATIADTGVGATGDGETFRRLRIVLTPSAATAYIDGTQVAQITTNLPESSRRFVADVRVVKTAGTTSRNLFVDWLGFSVEGSR